MATLAELVDSRIAKLTAEAEEYRLNQNKLFMPFEERTAHLVGEAITNARLCELLWIRARMEKE